MKISLITATYNSSATLSDTIESVLRQRYEEIEYIVVDGASDDGTMELVRRYEPLFKGRMRYISEPDRGIYDAMNKGIAMATGDVVGLLNSDDFFTSDDILEQVAAALGDPQIDAVYGDIHFVRSSDLSRPVRYYSSRRFRRWQMRLGFLPAHPSFYCRREVYLRYGLYDASYRIAADFELLLRLLFVHRIPTRYLPLDFVTMRTGGASTSGLRSHWTGCREHLRAYRKNGVRSNLLCEALRYLYKLGEVAHYRLKSHLAGRGPATDRQTAPPPHTSQPSGRPIPTCTMRSKKVFVSGCYDMLHSGHIAFFRAAAQYGDLYVGIGSDATIHQLKHRHTICSEQERLYMVRAVRYVTDAFINPGSGQLDFADTVARLRPDIFVVNADGASDEKRAFCAERGIRYVVLQRTPEAGLAPRSTTALRSGTASMIPYRLDLAGTWIDQPYVSKYAPGWAITLSLEPTVAYRERCGMSTSTRNAIRKIWPYELPAYRPELLAKLVFCFENAPERGGHVSGAQDAIGICMPGLVRHYYDGRYWPERIESCRDPEILDWLEEHLCLVEMFPRREGVSVIEGRRIDEAGVARLAAAADRCWEAILRRDLEAFAEAYGASFEAQLAMFPSMMQPGVGEFLDLYGDCDGILACKMAGAGGGGYLALVCRDSSCFPPGALRLTIRR